MSWKVIQLLLGTAKWYICNRWKNTQQVSSDKSDENTIRTTHQSLQKYLYIVKLNSLSINFTLAANSQIDCLINLIIKTQGYSKFIGDFIVYKHTFESFLKSTTLMKPEDHYRSLAQKKDVCSGTISPKGINLLWGSTKLWIHPVSDAQNTTQWTIWILHQIIVTNKMLLFLQLFFICFWVFFKHFTKVNTVNVKLKEALLKTQ